MSLIPRKIEVKNTKKISLDKYYTPKELAKRLIDKTFEILGEGNICEIIEPSAGDGSFSSQINCIAYDIAPESEGIIKQDFLELILPYKKGRLVIGNPPYGHGNTLSIAFYKKACAIGDYIAFILPISCLNGDMQMYYFDLIYSEDLGMQKYSDRELHCCFNIYKRPEKGINEKSDYTLKDIEIREYRRGGSYPPPPDGWDYAICNFGSGCFAKPIKHVGQYANELYFYCHKKEYKDRMLELLEFNTIRSYVKSISMKRMSKKRFYLYLRENIEGIK